MISIVIESYIYIAYLGSLLVREHILINEFAVQIGFEKCKGFSFFHAFTGYNTVSSFFKHSKITFLNC